MAKPITKKVRVSEAQAAQLAELAEAYDTTESEVLRYGLKIVNRLYKRRKHMPELIAMTEGQTWDPERDKWVHPGDIWSPKE